MKQVCWRQLAGFFRQTSLCKLHNSFLVFLANKLPRENKRTATADSMSGNQLTGIAG